MGFIIALLKFFLIMFVIGLIVVAIALYRGVKFFKKMTGGQNPFGQRQGQSSQGASYRSTQTNEGVTVEDHRNPHEANKKIFAPEEGEYVDFKEE